MDRRLLFAIPGLLVLIVVALAAWFIAREAHTKPATTNEQKTASSTEDLSGQAIYTNGEYGFAIVYPESAKVRTSFASYYHLPPTWRADASPDATGTPIVSISAFHTQSDQSYPRYYDALVRVGVSKDPKELSRCEHATNGEVALANTTINGTTFKTFSFQSAGMMQYAKGMSYRTLHHGYCFALEKIAVGSNYRDDPASAADISDDVLAAKYASLDAIVGSFSFASS